MKNTILLLLLLFSTTSFAQNAESIKIDVLKEEIIIGKLKLTKDTDIDAVIKVLGKAERIKKTGEHDRVFAYDSKGIAFNVKAGGSKKLESVTLTYTYDGDENVAKEKYTGELFIDKVAITEKTTTTEINEKTNVKLRCMGTLCMVDPKGKGLLVLLGTTENNEILQIAFGFK